jgi:iron complex transport system ATP-binding protein
MFTLTLENVRYTTEGCEILQGIDWQVPAGSCVAILGPNGSGKSTLLRMVTGYLYPTAGNVTVLGNRLGTVDVHELRRQIGVVDPGSPYLPEVRLTVLEVVLTGFFGNLCLDFDHPSRGQVDLAKEVLAEVGLAAHARQRFQTLSTGEGRRALLARALVHRPKLLILDEPTAGLDLLGRETMLATVDRLIEKSPGLTVLTVTHHLEELSPRTSDILLLRDGQRVDTGAPADVLNGATLSKAFGCPVRVHRDNDRWQWTVDPAVWGKLLGTAS